MVLFAKNQTFWPPQDFGLAASVQLNTEILGGDSDTADSGKPRVVYILCEKKHE